MMPLLYPGSIALIGAGKRPSSVGAVLAHNLFNAGFDGPVMPEGGEGNEATQEETPAGGETQNDGQ